MVALKSKAATQPQSSPRRAAAYLRVSTGEQEEHGTSLTSQEAACRAYVASHGYSLDDAHVYRETHSGADLWQRPQLTRVRDAIRRREVDVLLCHALDRLSRSQNHIGILVDECDRFGVRLELVTENFEDSAVGRFIRLTKAFAAEVEREKLLERTERGRRGRLDAGKMLPGWRAAFGYKWVNAAVSEDADERTRQKARRVAYAPDPETAPIVRRMFNLAASGIPLRRIAAQLTDSGRPLRTGKAVPWQVRSVHEVLTNPLYAGRGMAWRTRQVKDPVTGKRRHVPRPIEEQVPIPTDLAPPLIDADLFDAVQHRFTLNQQHATRNNKNPEATLLRGGYVKCGNCGCAMYSRLARKTPVYACSSGPRLGSKCNHGIAVRILDAEVWEHVERILKDPTLIAAELERMQAEPDPTAADLDAIERSLTNVAREQRNLVENLSKVNGAAATMIADKINALEAQRQQYTKERDVLLSRSATAQRARDQLAKVQTWCHTVAANLTTLTYGEKRTALDALGVQAKVWRTDHDPRYEITASIPLDRDIAFSTASGMTRGTRWRWV